MPFTPHLHPAARTGWRARALVVWLALLLVFGPTLGRVHSVVHLSPALATVAQGVAHAHGGAEHAHAHAPDHTGLAALFQHHAVLDCWDLEQLGHGHGSPSLDWQLPAPDLAAAPAWPPHAAPGLTPLRWFHARAPPARFMA